MGEDKHGNTPTRSKEGGFLPGQSGNPHGRPKGKKNHLTELKQDLEIAVRANVTSDQVGRIVNRLVIDAIGGDNQAAKIILDKFVTNAKDVEDSNDRSGGITIRIENMTQDGTVTIEGETTT